MSVYTQIAIVAAVVWALVLLISFLKKTFSVNRILLLLTLAFIAVFCFVQPTEKKESSVDEEETEYIDQVKADRYFAAIYAQNGDYDGALKLFSKSVGATDNKSDILELARLSALNGNYTKAKMYYQEFLKSEDNTEVKDELAYIEGFLGSNNGSLNGAVMEYLDQNNMTPEDAGFTNVDTDPAPVLTGFSSTDAFNTAITERLVKAAESGLSQSDAERIRSVGQNMAYVYTYVKDTTSQYRVADELETVAAALNKAVKSEGRLSHNDNVRNAALMANALTGNAKAVAGLIGKDSTVYELSVATELYVNGMVKTGDFRLFPKAPDKDVLNAVTDRCKEIMEDKGDDLSKDKRETLKGHINELEASRSKNVLNKILKFFTGKIASEPHGERSKLYLELAKGYDYVSDDVSVSNYIDSALENASISNDFEFAEVMTKILSIISNESNESVQKLAAYSKEALSRLMPVPMDVFRMKYEESKENGEGQLMSTATDVEDGAPKTDFTDVFTAVVTQKKSTINIGEIEKSQFPQITTKVSFGKEAEITEENIKDKILVFDCDDKIGTYEARKIKDQVSKVILLCDMSGSMRHDVDNLREAVRSYAEGMSESEKVSVAGFNSEVVFQTDFLSDKEQVKEYAERINADGYTAIYHSILTVAEMFTDDVNDNNLIIVMTDGKEESGYGRPDDSELTEKLNKLVAEHNCTIYTIGLGDGVENNYLEKIAEIGNGQYLYVDSAENLSSFYEFIHAQLNNSYILSYTAKNMVDVKRTLRVKYKELLGEATKNYSLSEDGTNTLEDYEKAGFDVKDKDKLQVYGFKTSYMYAGKADVELTLYGNNFKQNEEYDIMLSGPVRSYQLNYKYVSEKEFKVTVPYTIAPGTYSVTVSGSEESATAKDALTVVVGADQKVFKFGSYVFTCEEAYNEGDTLVLKNNVVMNGWLHFKGEVRFTGDYNDEVSQYCYMTDRSGSYVKYSVNGSTGIAKRLAEAGLTLPLPELGELKIYSEDYTPKKYREFQITTTTINAPFKVNGLADIGGKISLYPDMLYSEAFYSDIDLKYFKDIIKGLPQKIFQKEAEGALAISNTALLVKAKFEVNYDKDNDTDKGFQFGKIGFYIKKFGFDIDTISDEYSVNGAVGFKAFKLAKISEVKGFGLDLKWKGGKFDAFELSADVKQKVSEAPIPLTISKLMIGASGISEVEELKDVLNVTVTGGFNLEAGDVIEKVPKKVKEFFGLDSLPLAELDEAKISVTLGKFNVKFASNIKLLGIQIGKGTIELGKMEDYQNSVLNINGTEYGVDAKLEIGVHPEWENLKVDLDGEARITIGYPFSGLTGKFDFAYDLHWFIFGIERAKYGDFGIGLYFNSRHEPQFIVKAYGQDKKNNSSGGFRIDISSSMGIRHKSY
jgi:tetratricopeptide (TPR) repeat protein